MTITADWQIELPARSVLLGAGTNYDVIAPPGPTGLLGTPTVRSDDLDLFTDGAAAGNDRYSSRLITIPVNVCGDTPAETNERVRALAAAWRRSSDELALDVRVPGQPETVLRYFGRCRGVSESGWTLRASYHQVLLAFTALDPFCYGAAVASSVDTSTPLTLLAATMGDVGTVTDRAVLTIVGDGSTPTVTNTTTGGTIGFAEGITGTYLLDLHTQITTASGVNRDARVAASSDWFALAGGVDNTLTFSGCTSIQITYRPAYEVL